jgi:hypothetical protein
VNKYQENNHSGDEMSSEVKDLRGWSGDDRMLRVVSLGWGVQSWTIAAMVALGEIEPVYVALHSDTTWEYEETYEFSRTWTPWLEERGIRVVTVKDEPQAKKVIDDEHDILAFTNRIPVVNAWNNPEIPAHSSYPDGKPSGMLRRQCTGRWKIKPMRRWLRVELKRLGIKKGPGVVEQWLGISLDEIERAKDSNVKWQVHRFPLLEKIMTRSDCITWLTKNGLPIPPKSSCVFYPFHRRSTWQEMKRAGGKDWETAVEVDNAIRNRRPGFVCYVHPDRIPLSKIKIAEDFGYNQSSFDLIDAECDSGYCFL